MITVPELNRVRVERTLLSAAFDVAFAGVGKVRINIKIKINGEICGKIKINDSGQECPLYTY
jgi:hypothetical protein